MDLFLQEVKETTWIEWLAVIMSIAEVLLARINNIWLYPAGIIGTILYIVPLLEEKLYGESLLNAYYLVMSIYGWIYWLKKSDKPPVKITYSTKREWVITLAIVFIGWAALYLPIKTYTTSNVPLWDAWVSSTAWAGMWLLSRRKIENWILLNISNIFTIPLMFYKHLPMFAWLTVFLFIIGTWGYFDWQKEYKKSVV